jgi:hypothetical protein
MKHRIHAIACLIALSCQRAPVAETTERPVEAPVAVAPAPADAGRPVPAGLRKILPDEAGPPTLAAIGNLDRLPSLSERHRRLLANNGFFIAPQSSPAPGQTPAQARTSRRAKHLFQVYERNDYIRFPSYVTADLAIDLTHQYFDVVLRRTEREHLAPRLRVALQGFVREAEALRAAARDPIARAAARDAAVYWGTALQLLERPAAGDVSDVPVVRSPWEDDPEMAEETAPVPVAAPPATVLPKSIAKEVARRVALVHAAADKQRFEDWGIELDLTQTKPRGHYTGSGVMQRYFRAMSVLGMTSLSIDGEDARPDFLSAVTLSYEADAKARAAYEQVLDITSFVVGKPPTRGLAEAATARAAHATTLAEAVEPGRRAKIVAAWEAFPAHPVVGEGPVVQPFGQRVFGDTLAMSAMLPLMRELPLEQAPLVARSMGAAGAAAVLGSDVAKAIVVAGDAQLGPRLGAAIDTGRGKLGESLRADDAYHRTLRSLDSLRTVDPAYFAADAYELRMLQTFAGGWSMLRHDTLLYAYQMGAECDAEDQLAPYSYVEPATETYAGLRTMIAGFSAKLVAAGIEDAAPSDDDSQSWDTPFQTTAAKTKALDEFLQQLQKWVDKQERGERLTEDERTELATIGGFAEHVLLTLADAYELGDGNDDMAIIADVFTFRGQALEVGVGHPELIYAVIPTPDGWRVARGAVLGYREFFVAAAQRMTDETWRARLAASKDFEVGARPEWLAPISAEPVGVVELAKDEAAQERCGYYGGVYAL